MWYEFFIETIKKEIRKRRQSTQKNIKGNMFKSGRSRQRDG